MPEEYRQSQFARPPGATEILLVRHGESRAATPSQPFPLVDGHGDPELHAAGREQAVRVGERLRHLPVAAVYVTNLRRTVETATPLCEHLGQRMRVDVDLREVHLGEWEGGRMRKYAHENHPTWQRVQAEERWDAIPGAESATAFNARVLAGVHRIAAAHVDSLVVAVVHGGVIGSILAQATQARPFAFVGADNGSISHIVVSGERIVLRRFNDVAHLAADLTTPRSYLT